MSGRAKCHATSMMSKESSNIRPLTYGRICMPRIGLGVIAGLLTCVALAATAAPASAITDSEELVRFGSEGSAAGQVSLPSHIATDPVTGHVFIPSLSTSRVDEFTPWGKFVKAIGWDVAPGAVNEQQEIRVRATAGQFRLSFGASTTADLAFNAPGKASEGSGSVEAAVNGLASISAGGGSVGVEAIPGSASGITPRIYIIKFTGGSLAGTDVAQLGVENGSIPLGGGSPTTSLEARTRADGTPGGTGLEACTEESGCKGGLEGTGAGEFGNAFRSVSVAANGDIYVGEGTAHRVQKFTSAGRFLLMFGREVDKTTGEDVCTVASGDICGAGIGGAGPGQFSEVSPEIAIGSTGTVFAGSNEHIQVFEPSGVFDSEIKIPGEAIRSFALDPVSGDFYVGAKESVRRLNPSGTQVGSLSVRHPEALVIGSNGNVYVLEPQLSEGEASEMGVPEHPQRILQFDSSGQALSPPSCCSPPPVPGHEFQNFVIQGLGINAVGDLYTPLRSVFGPVDGLVRVFGPGPVSFESPPPLTPSIVNEYATSVTSHDATLGTEINPHFWDDTRYYLQYGTEGCEAGGCASLPLPPGDKLANRAVDAPVKSSGIFLQGLKAGTTYHYRFVAESSGGGSVVGPDATFTTFAEPESSKSCPANEAFRNGASAMLPDCRAYEMVSPLDKGGADIFAAPDITNFSNALDQSSIDGEKLTYSSYRAFGDSKAAPYTSQYIATRHEGEGWSTEVVAAAQGPTLGIDNFDSEYKAFNSDLSSFWLLRFAVPTLGPGAPEGFPNLYRRDNLTGAYEAVSTAEPTKVGLSQFLPELQAYSADGTKAIFRIQEKLTPDAEDNLNQVYESSDGELHLVCILPNGTTSKENCSAGTAGGSPDRTASVHHAISEDGSRVYWTASVAESSPGRIYLRVNPGQPQSILNGSECTEPEAACTVAISQSGVKALFWGASPEGSKALYSIRDEESSLNGNLYLSDFEGEGSSRQLVARETFGVAGASEDLGKIYFVSGEAIAGTSGASAGAPNLYLYEAGGEGAPTAVSFIATLSSADVSSNPSDVNPWPVYHAAHASLDGKHLAFISTAAPTSYDNTDAATGTSDSEVYVYDAESGELHCASCNPSGARPEGRNVEAPGTGGFLATASSLSTPPNQLYTPRPLSANGSRLFFNSYDALLPKDTNGKEDVYEWERAGAGSCTGESSAFSPQNGGCIYLISSGENPADSEFTDADPSGTNAFFSTGESLLKQDPGLIDIYDARVGGGFPPPPGPPAPCEGEACQGPLSPPNDPTPASSSFRGAGNVVEKSARKKAHKKRHAKKKRHNRNRQANHGRTTNSNRRAGR